MNKIFLKNLFKNSKILLWTDEPIILPMYFPILYYLKTNYKILQYNSCLYIETEIILSPSN